MSRRFKFGIIITCVLSSAYADDCTNAVAAAAGSHVGPRNAHASAAATRPSRYSAKEAFGEVESSLRAAAKRMTHESHVGKIILTDPSAVKDPNRLRALVWDAIVPHLSLAKAVLSSTHGDSVMSFDEKPVDSEFYSRPGEDLQPTLSENDLSQDIFTASSEVALIKMETHESYYTTGGTLGSQSFGRPGLAAQSTQRISVSARDPFGEFVNTVLEHFPNLEKGSPDPLYVHSFKIIGVNHNQIQPRYWHRLTKEQMAAMAPTLQHSQEFLVVTLQLGTELLFAVVPYRGWSSGG